MNKKNSILISVIVPSYNRANTVGQTIESIISQQVDADIEIVIGDDCSTDNAREVLLQYKEKYPDIIRSFFWEKNLGLGANWASCIKECKGKYICNCDNDDYWHNLDKLQLQLDHMESHPDCNVLITNHRCHNRDTGVITEEVAKIDRTIPLQKAMWGGSSFCNATIMYRADFMKAHLDLDEFINRRLSLQDWPAWVILAAYTDFDVLPVSTATFGIETVSITRPDTYERLERRYKGDAIVYEYLCELFPEKFPFDKEGWKKYANSQLLALAYRKADYKGAKKYAKLTGGKSLKVLCAKCYITFYLFVWLKKFKKTMRR
ncbi:MAG: glycosyltransferase family 2 protein [Paludibacteraceae bacterium]|nr:glycosyltransferase family 2 protein [Paludibacteraceae bacterium]